MTKPKPPEKRICLECQKEYTARRKWQKFCGPNCRFVHFFKAKAAREAAQ